MNKPAAALLALAFARALAAATTGTVFTTSGDVVAKAEVAVYRFEDQNAQRARLVAREERVPLAKVATGDDGAFSIDTKARGALELLVTCEGFAPARQLVLADDDVTVELVPAKTETGHVTANGKPVAGALVVGMVGETAVWQTRTNERGAFTIADPRRWLTGIAVLHPGFAIHNGKLSLAIALSVGERVSGAVTSAKGEPAAGATLLADGWPAGTAGKDGKFILGHVPASAKSLQASLKGAAGSALRKKGELAMQLGEPRSIAGTVRDVNKRPIAGAPVAILSADIGLNAHTVTDDQGNYRIEGLVAGSYVVRPILPARLHFETAQIGITGDTNAARADFTASAAKLLRGTVVDERKRPVAGAAVQYGAAPPLYAFAVEGMASVRTGRDGRFELPLFSDGGFERKVRVQALHPRFATAVSEAIDADVKPMTLVLRDGIELAGTVVDADGKPVAGAGVVALEEPFGTGVLPLDNILAAGFVEPFAETDAEGRFSLRLNDKPHDLGVFKESFAGARVAIARPDGKPVRIVLQRGAEVRGKVVQKGAAEAPQGFVTATADDGTAVMARTEEGGSFVIKGLRAGEYILSFADMGGRSAETRLTAPATNVQLELTPLAQVQGRVVDDATGQPLDVAYSVSVNAEDFSSFNQADFGAGEPFTVPASAGGVTVTVRAPGYTSQSLEAHPTVETPAQLTVRLTRGRSVSGRVVDDKGLAVAGAAVSVSSAIDFNESVETQADGSFVVEGAPREEFELNVVGEQHVGVEVNVPAGTGDPRLEVVLRRGATMSGRVVTSAGMPVEKATVVASPTGEAGDTRQAVTDEAGRFTLQGLGNVPHSLAASDADGRKSEPLIAEAGATDVVLTMRPPASTGAVHGRVHGFTERKWQYGMVHASAGGTAMIGRDGTFRLEHLPAGEVELRAYGTDAAGNIAGTSAPVKVTVVADGDVEANLSFRDDVVLRGVVTEDGRPVARADVEFYGDGNGEQWSAKTNELGMYEITGIGPGLYSVKVAAGKRPYRTRHHVTGSGTFDIAIDVAQLSGRIVDGSGNAVAKAAISIARAATGEHELADEADADGSFLVSVPKGEYLVTAAAPGFIAATERARSGGASLLITLARGDGLSVQLIDAASGKLLTGYVVAIAASGVVHSPVKHDAGRYELPLPPGDYRVAASADGFASQFVRVSVPATKEVRLPLTPGGSLVIRSQRAAAELVKLILPGGEEYVQCHCNGVAEIRLAGSETRVPHVAPGTYTLRVLDHAERIIASYPVTIVEGQTTTAEIHVPE